MDGIEYIDASPNNVITGMAIVSRPAYPEATATRLVAEDTSGGMQDVATVRDDVEQTSEAERVDTMT